jgi:hypothetical protein
VTSVDVTVKKLPIQPVGALQLALMDSNSQLISSRDFPLTGLSPNGVVTLPVKAADWALKQGSNQLTIRIESQGLAATDALGIAISTPRQYRDGIFTLGGEKQDADLVFHYTCANPWTGN